MGRSLLQLLHLQGHHRADRHATQAEPNAATTAGTVKVEILKFGRIVHKMVTLYFSSSYISSLIRIRGFLTSDTAFYFFYSASDPILN